MSLKKIRVFPDPILRKRCKNVKHIDNTIKSLSKDMIDTMDYAGGIGLAANQIGILKRVVTLHLPEEDHRIIINPKIEKKFGVREVIEGCLSFPGYTGLVKRSINVRAKWLDLNGSYFKLTAEDLFSQALEHEIDHLNGILYIDHLLAHQKLTDSKVDTNEITPHNHDVELDLHVHEEDIKEDNVENIQTKLDLSKIYSDSSLEDLKFDLHTAGYLSDLNDKNSISSQ